MMNHVALLSLEIYIIALCILFLDTLLKKSNRAVSGMKHQTNFSIWWHLLEHLNKKLVAQLLKFHHIWKTKHFVYVIEF